MRMVCGGCSDSVTVCGVKSSKYNKQHVPEHGPNGCSPTAISLSRDTTLRLYDPQEDFLPYPTIKVVK